VSDEQPKQITQGLLDGLVLALIMDPASTTPSFLGIEIVGLPGLRATLKIEAVQELRQALDIILGPRDLGPGNEVVIYGDADPLDLMASVNKALATCGLRFADKSVDGADHCVFVLEHATSEVS